MDEPLIAVTPVAFGDSNDDVHHLHLLLAALGRRVDQGEWETREYGRDTAEVVGVLLQHMNTGEDDRNADSGTAGDINDFAYNQGVFFRVTGGVFAADGSVTTHLADPARSWQVAPFAICRQARASPSNTLALTDSRACPRTSTSSAWPSGHKISRPCHI